MDPGKGSLLYICPVMPSLTGSGLAMRAGIVLDALCRRYRVSALVISMYAPFESQISESILNRCADYVLIPPDPDPQLMLDQAADAYRGRKFDTVHVFRLSAAPFARPYLKQEPPPACHLDLDDIDSKTHRRISALHRDSADEANAEREASNARKSALIEAAAFRMFDRIYVCSEDDRSELQDRCRSEIRVLKNAVRIPAPLTPPPCEGPRRLLFIGTLGYYPNQDAARFFCTQVLPLIRSRMKTPCVVDLVGSGDSAGLRDLAGPDVTFVGRVADVRPYYEAASAVIVPIRAGGGTRIKILEAFSYRRPVIATTIGAEGLEVIGGRHLLLADTPEAFADACLNVMSDPVLAESLVENAEDLLRRCHTTAALEVSLSAS